MELLHGSSAGDEPDLRVGNKGLSDKDGCWNESDWDDSDGSKSSKSDGSNSHGSDESYLDDLSSKEYSACLVDNFHKYVPPGLIEGLLSHQKIVDHVLMCPEVFKCLLKEPALLARLLMMPQLLAHLLMVPELLARLLMVPELLKRLLIEPERLQHLLIEQELLKRLLIEPERLQHLLIERELLKRLCMKWFFYLFHNERRLLTQVFMQKEVVESLLIEPEHLLIEPKCLLTVPELFDHLSKHPCLIEDLIIKQSLGAFMLTHSKFHGTVAFPKAIIPESTIHMTDRSGPRPEYDALFLNSQGYHGTTTNAIGNPVGKDIFMLSLTGNGGSSSEGTSSNHIGDNRQRVTSLATNRKPIVIFDTGAEVSVTGDEDLFAPLRYSQEGYGLRGANENEMTSNLCGYVNHEMFMINHVYFSEDVGARTIISGPELDLLGYSSKCEGGICEVRDKGTLVGKGRLIGGKYLMDYLKIPLNRAPVPFPVADGPGLLPVGQLSEVSEVQVADGLDPLATGPFSDEPALTTALWKAVRGVWRRFVGSLAKRASTQAPGRLPV